MPNLLASKALLDADILSEIYKGVDQTVLDNAASYLREFSQLTFTSVSVHEVLYGFYAQGALKRANDFSKRIAVHEEVAPTSSDYRLAAEIRAALQKAGTPIGSFDPLIAACAIGRDLPLVTGNTRHYGFIQKSNFALRLLNWRIPQQ